MNRKRRPKAKHATIRFPSFFYVFHQVEGQLCRMPSYFPNYELAMIPLQQSQIDEFQRTGHISSAITFRTSVKMNKVEVKKYLQASKPQI